MGCRWSSAIKVGLDCPYGTFYDICRQYNTSIAALASRWTREARGGMSPNGVILRPRLASQVKHDQRRRSAYLDQSGATVLRL
jgi:hypothetical protein